MAKCKVIMLFLYTLIQTEFSEEKILVMNKKIIEVKLLQQGYSL